MYRFFFFKFFVGRVFTEGYKKYIFGMWDFSEGLRRVGRFF